MKKLKLILNIDWKSKIIDFLIVILGITIAFKLNSWNESSKTDLKAKDYIKSFYDENVANESSLDSALQFCILNKNNIDTLKGILLSGNYSDDRIKTLTSYMMAVADYSPSIITMENIKSSGEFEIIKDIELRKQLISTYNSYTTSSKFENILSEYIDKYATPYFFENLRFSDFSSIHADFIKDPLFENIVFGYDVLLGQQIKGYQDNLKKIKQLNESLRNVTSSDKYYSKAE